MDLTGIVEMKTWYSLEGSPYPLGVSYVPEEESYNFAIYSKYATRLQLLVFNHDPIGGVNSYAHPNQVYEFDYKIQKSERVWHIRILKSALGDGVYYAYRVWGPESGPGRYRFQAFDPEKIMLDPFARAIFFPPDFSRAASCNYGPNIGKAPVGLISVNDQPFQWEGYERPKDPSTGAPPLIIYETHIKQFTSNVNAGIPDNLMGTYKGMIHKINYLKELGINAVELMPVHQWDPQEGSKWGYMTLNFFSPHHGYSSNRKLDGAHVEFKEMVKAFHKEGIRVILDVVFNHTTEGDQQGPLYSYKGIDNSTYYLSSDGDNGPYSYMNFSGTGNTLHCSNQHVRFMILESLRYWHLEMKVDGFRFDIASILARNTDGSIDLSNPPVLF
jgi:glycogen operon protein